MSRPFIVGILFLIFIFILVARRGQIGLPGAAVLVLIGAIVFGHGGGSGVNAGINGVSTFSQYIADLGRAVQ